MRKIILYINSTFHGVVPRDPSEDTTNLMVWTTEASVRNGSEFLLKTMETVDTVLLGRARYEDVGRMSKWPVSRTGQAWTTWLYGWAKR